MSTVAVVLIASNLPIFVYRMYQYDEIVRLESKRAG
jgi:hypothetical protein